ncbi:MAG: gliding motility-associated C-terminal domain-containing protein [Crocinitomicaceae bacterium]|nr:gliding motility-associated C-terminal domain-containing protein [Crocinitomicaceae bacterium]
MKDNDYIKELFKNKLEHVETSVRPELWNNIASSIGTSTSTVTTSSLFSVSKLIITSLTLVSLGVLTYYITVDDSTTEIESKSRNVSSNKVINNTFTVQKDSKKTNVLIKNLVASKSLVIQKDSLIIATLFSSSISENTIVQTNLPIDNNHSSSIDLIEIKDSNYSLDLPFVKTEEPLQTESHQTDLVVIDSKDFVFPNVFTPNNDGTNDKFELNTINLSDFSIVILNAKNETIYQSTTIDFSWDGRLQNGELVPAGRYIYYIVGQLPDGKPYTKINPLSIID